MIKGCFDRYSEFASYKENFFEDKKQSKNKVKKQFRIEDWVLQPFFKNLYYQYCKVELEPDKKGFNSFGRKNKLDFIDKNNKILFEIKRNHKNANWGWGTAIDQFISVKASKDFCNNGDFQDYKFFLFIVDFIYTEPLTEEEKRILDDNEICYYRVYKNKKLSIETNIY